MSVLYDRLKNVEKEKRPESPISEEEGFPIEGEIKRQKSEQQRRRKRGGMGGLFLFFVLIFIGAVIISVKDINRKELSAKPSVKKLLTAPSAEKAKPASAEKTEPTAVAEKATATSASEKTNPSASPEETKSASPTEKAEITPVEGTKEEAVTTAAISKAATKPESQPGKLFEEGAQLYKQHKYEEAVAVYMQGLQDNPQYAVGYNNLGVVYYKQDELRKSSAQFKQAVEFNPRYAEAHYNLAVVLEKLGQEKKALIHYLKFLEFAPLEQYKLKNKELQDKVQAHIRYYY